ncbi:MliC family protein [Vibrio makurazakiensis]|uniref:MliC family protein n=1 Tax=Vibrio makurazakiensis TaxID=2910250 RepID=UPI003D0A14C5
MKSLFIASLCTIALVGCSKSAAPEGVVPDDQFVTYQCESNASFDVAFLEGEKAVLRLPKHEYRLVQVAAGSGVKYILDDGTAELLNNVTLRTKGENARLELGRVVYKNCHL